MLNFCYLFYKFCRQNTQNLFPVFSAKIYKTRPALKSIAFLKWLNEVSFLGGLQHPYIRMFY